MYRIHQVLSTVSCPAEDTQPLEKNLFIRPDLRADSSLAVSCCA